MQIAVKKWGNSVGIRIPSVLLQALNLQANSYVDIQEENGRLVIAPVKPKFQLEQLLAGISDENKHHEIDMGQSVGKEML